MTLADSNAAANLPDVAVVRAMTDDDADFAAALHVSALDHGFFARLGVPFLSEYYRSFIDSPQAVAFVADSAAGPTGMVVGTVGRSHYSWMLRHRGWRLLRTGTAALLRRPPELVFFVRARLLWYLGSAARAVAATLTRGGSASDAGPPATAVLMHIAVSPDARGTGTGALMVEAFLDAARHAGCEDAMLVTLAGREGAGRFYRRLGWRLRDLRPDRDGRLHECYERRL